MNMMSAVFWLCCALIVYTYLGYPILLWLISRVRRLDIAKADIRPTVSMIIAAFNEERVIRAKIENALAQRYPTDLWEIVIAADGSTDATESIAREYEADGVRVLHEEGRKGKSAAISRAADTCSSDILFFSDANTIYDPDVIETLTRNFADPSVGGVTGRKVIIKHAERTTSEGETALWSYQGILRRLESRLGSVVTADGEVFAVRRELFEPIPPYIVHDDMYLTLLLVERGHRVVYEPDARSAEYASQNLWDEFHLKVRYAAAGYQILSVFRKLVFPPRTLFALEVISHKLLRWLAHLFLIGVFVSSALAAGPFYRLVFWLQVVFYSAAVVGLVLPKLGQLRVFYFPLYFTMGNAAGLYGTLKYFLKGQSTQWRRAAR
jgi:cellulose synthase/poly-beta-1,6-N-acetylglucosamine synthase-like glycosyltransferase